MEELEAEGGVGGGEGAEEEGADGLRKTKREKRQREVCVGAQVRRCVKCVRLLL